MFLTSFLRIHFSYINFEITFFFNMNIKTYNSYENIIFSYILNGFKISSSLEHNWERRPENNNIYILNLVRLITINSY
jgi:hypothetical protein